MVDLGGAAPSLLTAEQQDAVRDAVRQVMAAEAMTMTAVAKAAGIPYGTFSAWLGGTYQGRGERVADEAGRWLEARKVEQRTRALAPTAPEFLMTPSAEAFFGVFAHAQHMIDLVIISGGAGVGKTSAAEAYRARTPNTWVLTAEPCFSTPRMLLDDLAETLGISERYSAQKVSRAIVRRLRDCGGLLIIDEAQHLGTLALDQLRTIHDLAHVGVALVGNESVYARLEGAARTPAFAQLYSRVGMRLPRAKPVKRDIDALLDAWKVEGERERRLLHAIARKPGALRGMTKTLRMAHMLAGAEGAAMSEQYVLMAWQRLSNSDLTETA